MCRGRMYVGGHCQALLLLVVALTSAGPAVAQTANPPSGRPLLGRVLTQVARDFVALPSRATFTVLGIGGATALGAGQADRHVNRQLDNSDYRFLTPGRVIGSVGVQAGVAAGTYAVGHAFNRGGTAQRIGAELIRAQVVTQSLTLGVKVAIRRERPDGGTLSFPSGHASTTFATATVLARHFGWRVSVPTYLAATYVASSRLHQHRHYLSDVVFGAALGIAAGRTITAPESALTWIPVVTPTRVAVMVTYAR